MADVVVLPCVPVTARQRRSAAIWARRSARCSSRAAPPAAPGCRAGWPWSTRPRRRSGTLAAAWPITGSIPCVGQPVGVAGGGAVGAGDLRAERGGDESQAAHARAADPDEVQATAGPGAVAVCLGCHVPRARLSEPRDAYRVSDSAARKLQHKVPVMAELTHTVFRCPIRVDLPHMDSLNAQASRHVRARLIAAALVVAAGLTTLAAISLGSAAPARSAVPHDAQQCPQPSGNTRDPSNPLGLSQAARSGPAQRGQLLRHGAAPRVAAAGAIAQLLGLNPANMPVDESWADFEQSLGRGAIGGQAGRTTSRWPTRWPSCRRSPPSPRPSASASTPRAGVRARSSGRPRRSSAQHHS